jgi:hypothetical protein
MIFRLSIRPTGKEQKYQEAVMRIAGSSLEGAQKDGEKIFSDLISTGLPLAAAPTFAVMAVLTADGDAGQMVCSAASHMSSLSGMVPMYVLMSAFHAAPWVKLLSRLASHAAAAGAHDGRTRRSFAEQANGRLCAVCGQASAVQECMETGERF